jgi:hypothetical protein
VSCARRNVKKMFLFDKFLWGKMLFLLKKNAVFIEETSLFLKWEIFPLHTKK